MRRTILTIILLGTLTTVFSQAVISADSISKKLENHFELYPAELYRYGGLTMYGESTTKFDQKQIDSELELFNDVKNSDIINNPTNIVFALCHNIIIHSPESGKEFLLLLNKPTKNEEIVANLFLEAIFTGEFGEKMALNNLNSTDADWSRIWAKYLSKNAIYDSSIPTIQEFISTSSDTNLQIQLLYALMYISGNSSNDFVKDIIDTTQNDHLQSAAIFVYAELAGYDAIKYLESVMTTGEKSAQEKKSSVEWLKKETSPKNKYGTEVVNDIEFINRFGDIQSPALIWAEKEGLLTDKIVKNPIVLSKEKKDQLIDLLIESKGFGLEAVKGSLFLSIEKTDIERLLLLRQLNVYSPNRFTQSRAKTIGLFIRYLKRV